MVAWSVYSLTRPLLTLIWIFELRWDGSLSFFTRLLQDSNTLILANILLVWVQTFLLIVWNNTLSGICIWCPRSFYNITLSFIGLLLVNSSRFRLRDRWLIGKPLFIFFVLQFFLMFFKNFLCHTWNCLFAKLLRIDFIVWWLIISWLNIWCIHLIRVFESLFSIIDYASRSV